MTLSQAELTELYMDALLKNPEAIPPLHLDAETANLIRAMVIHRRRDQPSEDVQDRVWRQVLFGLHATPEESPAERLFNEAGIDTVKENRILSLPRRMKHPKTVGQGMRFRTHRHTHRAGMLVATIFTLLFFSGLLLRSVNELPTDNTATPITIQNTYGASFDPGMRLLPGDGREQSLIVSYNSKEDIPGVSYWSSAFHELTP